MRAAPGRLAHRDPVALVLPVVVPFAVFLLAPLAIFFVYSFLSAKLFSVSGPLTLDAYRRAFSTALNAELAINSLAIGLLAAAVSMIVSRSANRGFQPSTCCAFFALPTSVSGSPARRGFAAR